MEIKLRVYRSDLREVRSKLQDIIDNINKAELDVLHSQLIAAVMYIDEKILYADKLIGDLN